MELAAALVDGQLDTLRLFDDGTRYLVCLERTYDPNVKWSDFNHRFDSDSLPCAEPKLLDDAGSRLYLQQAGASAALEALEARLREGHHQLMTLRVEPRLGMRLAIFVHNSTLGRGNGMHALRAGGLRLHHPNADEQEVFADGCNLARAMSYKNAAADLPMGGCKMTLQSSPIPLDDGPRLGFLARCIESARILTGPDMGFTPEHVDALRAQYTLQCTGGNLGPLGPTGIPTAFGVFLAIREAARHTFGSPELTGRTVAVQGLGFVGRPLAEHLATAGAKLVVADIDERAVTRLRELVPNATVVAPEQVLTTPCDVLAPCARGGQLDEATIDRLQCKMVFGAANNPLKASTQQGEINLARRLAKRGILFQIDWLHNTAGVMSGFEEYLRGSEATQEHLRPRLERVCKDGTAEVLRTAAARGITPTEYAYEKIETRLFPRDRTHRNA